tara:strand:+ start:12347 stop:12700 length:354 start_codon:yes stop_codon:yes gene_type:complete
MRIWSGLVEVLKSIMHLARAVERPPADAETIQLGSTTFYRVAAARCVLGQMQAAGKEIYGVDVFEHLPEGRQIRSEFTLDFGAELSCADRVTKVAELLDVLDGVTETQFWIEIVSEH